MGIRHRRITVHGVPVDICEDIIGAFFSQYGSVYKVSSIKSKAGIATGDMVLYVTLTRQDFGEVPYTLMCPERRMLVVVAGLNRIVGHAVHWATC